MSGIATQMERLKIEECKPQNQPSVDDMARWILSISPAHAQSVQQLPEFSELQQAFCSLQAEYGKMVETNGDNVKKASATPYFLQDTATEVLVLRILDFLETKSLSRTMQTCTRLRHLVDRNLHQRTQRIRQERQLPSDLHLLRAQEQIQGTNSDVAAGSSRADLDDIPLLDETNPPSVRIPSLLLSRGIRVSNSGDPDYNGIYYCSGCNGNGFVFTKPRYPFQRVRIKKQQLIESNESHRNAEGDTDSQSLDRARVIYRTDNNIGGNNAQKNKGKTDDEDSEDGYYHLRCIFAKKFSNETIYWYLSKEIVEMPTQTQPPQTNSNPPQRDSNNNVTQQYSFWARLSQQADVSDPNDSRYPSQTSNLIRNGGAAGWQSFSQDVAPPTVELL